MTDSNIGEADTDGQIVLSTNGIRSYVEINSPQLGEEFGSRSITGVISLVNNSLVNPQAWTAMTMNDPDLAAVNKKGIYSEVELDDAIESDNQRNELVESLQPVEGVEFSWENRGVYYIESQTIDYGDGRKLVYTYAYRGGDQVPAYADLQKMINGQIVARSYLKFATLKFEADAGLMDFDNVLSNYIYVDTSNTENMDMARTFKADAKNAKRAVVW